MKARPLIKRNSIRYFSMSLYGMKSLYIFKNKEMYYCNRTLRFSNSSRSSSGYHNTLGQGSDWKEITFNTVNNDFPNALENFKKYLGEAS